MRPNLQNFLSRALAPLSRRVSLLVSRGVVTIVNDALKMQNVQLQVLSDEVQDDVEHFQEYGFTSHAFAGSEALLISVGGNRTHGIAACVTDRRHRPKDMGEGDVCLFTDKGERVYLDRATDIVHLGAKSAAEFVALAAKTNQELSDIKTAFDAHVHPTGVGPSGAPTVPMPVPDSVAATKVKAT